MRKNKKGQTITEYAVIIGLVVVAAIVAWKNLGTEIGATVTDVTQKLTEARSGR